MNVLSAIFSISGIDMIQARREFIPYLALSVILLAFDRGFTLLVRISGSLSMNLMFLPVLIGGIFWVAVRAVFKERLTRHKLYRLCSFLYHMALTMLVNGLLIQGMLESFITESKYLSGFWLISGLSGLLFIVSLWMILSAASIDKRK